MAVSVGSSITASDYNNIRSTLVSIYSTSFGQTMRSSAVTSSVDKVSSEQLLNLYLDAQSAYVHQIGSVSTTIAVPAAGQTIGADTSQTFNQTTGAKATPAGGATMGVNDYESIVTSISNFNGSVSGWPDTNFSVGTPTNSARSTGWGGAGQVQSIYHVVTFTFASLAQRNYFFNAGGELRFSANLSAGAGSKDTDWSSLLSAMGTIKFDKYRITASSGTPTPVVSGGSGYDSLTSTYRQLFIKSGSGVYADNDYTIEGRIVSNTVLRFRITFNDGDTGTGLDFPDPIDESVGGTTTSIVNTFRPDSSFIYNSTTYNAVDIAAPTIATAVALTVDNPSAPA